MNHYVQDRFSRSTGLQTCGYVTDNLRNYASSFIGIRFRDP